jgi:hypothetical protein
MVFESAGTATHSDGFQISASYDTSGLCNRICIDGRQYGLHRAYKQCYAEADFGFTHNITPQIV